MEMILSAAMIDAQEAHRIGLVNHVVEPDQLIMEARALAAKIQRNSPMAIAAAIKSVNAGYEDGVNGYNIEIAEFGACFGTDDFKEGTTAFLEKRRAKFSSKNQ